MNPHAGVFYPRCTAPKAGSTPRAELSAADDVNKRREGDPEEELSQDGS